MAHHTLAELLLRRKTLNDKVAQLKAINVPSLFETKVARRQITDTIDDISATVPKLTASQVTEEYDYYAKQLRLVDAAIQQANWTTQVEVTGVADIMADYSEWKNRSGVASVAQA